MRRRALPRSGVVAVSVLLGAGATTAFAQESKSAPIVKEFVQLAGGEMRYVAAKVPDKPDEFVGALHIPGIQLLVVWARYEQPKLLADMLAKRDYQGIYTDLNSASYTVAESKVFFEDLRADGFYPKRQDENSAFDMYDTGGKRLMFDGDWKKQKLSEKEYLDTFASAEDRYTKAVQYLVGELKRGS
jgi:hypothetical protein